MKLSTTFFWKLIYIYISLLLNAYTYYDITYFIYLLYISEIWLYVLIRSVYSR